MGAQKPVRPRPSSTPRSTGSSRTLRGSLQTTRYARQHLNFSGGDLAWHQTINHADWLALSMATEEPRAAIEKFLEKK